MKNVHNKGIPDDALFVKGYMLIISVPEEWGTR